MLSIFQRFNELILNLIVLSICVNGLSTDSNIRERTQLRSYCDDTDDFKFSESIYERLVYFSKACALTSCISTDSLIPGKTLKEGGCPSHIRFCHDEKENPTVSQTKIELVLEAEKGELGTGYVLVDHGRQVVIMAFRSSATTQDWFSDFTIVPTKYTPICQKDYKKLIDKGEIKECKNCQIHRGFHKFTETLSRDFLKKMEDILEKYPDFHVVTVGHSLGAALACIAGIELRLRGYKPLVLTYAPPKIFNQEMQEWVDDLFETEAIHEKIMDTGEIQFDHGYYRVVHNQDYIPMVPPFYHVAGLEIFIRKIELPHCIKDLEYIGSREIPSKRDSFVTGITDVVEEWFHTYEHRSYFINLMGCSGF